MTYTYWIQHSDFSVPPDHDGPALQSADQAIEIFEGYDWATQNTYEDAREHAEEDSCPAGMSIVGAGGDVLHLCPRPIAHTFMLHLTRTRESKRFGLLKTRTSIHQASTISPCDWRKAVFGISWPERVVNFKATWLNMKPESKSP